MIGANAIISIYNLINGTNTDGYSAADFTGIEAYIESKSADLVQVLGEQHNIETFDLYCEPLDIKVGAKVIDDKGREYRVMGIERHENNLDTDDLLRVTVNSKQI